MDESDKPYGFTAEEWETCLKVLGKLKDDPLANPDNQRFGALITKIHKNAKKQLKGDELQRKKQEDRTKVKQSTIAKRALNNTSAFAVNNSKDLESFTKLNKERNCYSCNTPYHLLHNFYHRLCPPCAQLNYARRFSILDLSNRKIILTGGRVKVGYATALKLLQCNAQLTITTRFPGLAFQQFRQEPDFEEWKDHLNIYGLDLRNLSAVRTFIANYKSKNQTLDILINNAAQTIKYDATYYQPLIAQEQQLNIDFKGHHNLIENTTPVVGATNLLDIDPSIFPIDKNRFGQPVDHRTKTSWNARLTEIELPELLEVNLINQISPYILIKEFTPLLKSSSFLNKFIINVTSSEGQFSYTNKTIFHPHTNMTKAALNMLTKTSAKDYEKDHIFMNCVDVGWISTGAHEALRKKQFENATIPPLDSVDGAARILHPIFEALKNNTTFVGELLKNYIPVNW